ncbi:hypothetical protein J7J47_02495 [Halomonas sp. ISL-60]|uniref:hypothetical protein n=1 Tax=Halomonas sp. ISL-56 TaxID=2819149 RepID=UPI001BEB37B3|nr:hypothetical protein [Halomonas sp. ISL-56]MBT2771100.1 hypothetical protein [Halomonas sp. ISL-60]MBT2799824.1 hypothetical protein [Halomonas sp. ISL-56]
MVDIVAFLVFLIFTPKIIRTIRSESAIYDEFGQRKILPVFLLLLPASPVLLMVVSFTIHWVAGAIVAALCFLPVLIIARQDTKAFEISGTSRTDRAKGAANMAFSAALVGFLYIGIHVIFQLTIGAI